MKIALTGITGFVGQNLMPMIVEQCADVELMTLNVESDIQKAREMYPWPNCYHILTTELDELVKFNPEVVLHLATVTTERNNTEIIRPMLAANIEFGVLLLDALTRCDNLRLFVNTGSFAEYRFGPSEINDAYLYAATKSAFRHFCDYYSQLKGFKYVTIVPYTIYGGMPTVKRLMDYIIESIGAESPVDMTAGEQILDFTHVDDLAGFYVHILNHVDLFCGFENGEEFHIGTGKGTTIVELVGLVEQIFERKCNINFGGRPYRERDTMHAVAPIAKNLNLARWRAKISLEEGIKRMRSNFYLNE